MLSFTLVSLFYNVNFLTKAAYWPSSRGQTRPGFVNFAPARPESKIKFTGPKRPDKKEENISFLPWKNRVGHVTRFFPGTYKYQLSTTQVFFFLFVPDFEKRV